ncbi:MAG: DUF4339 domain-containing protein [Polyangiaceae bacterium]
MATADKWRWTDEDGVQRLLGHDELRVALEEGRLRPGTLVWKKGMANWLPAADVAELKSEVPPASDDAFTERRERPSNIIDIEALQKARNSTRSGSAASEPPPPSSSAVPSFSTRPKTVSVDQNWERAPESGEDTVTRVASPLSSRDDDEATQARALPRATRSRRDVAHLRPRSHPSKQAHESPPPSASAPPPPSRGALPSDELLSAKLLRSSSAVSRPLGVDNATASGVSSARAPNARIVVMVDEEVSSQGPTDIVDAAQIMAQRTSSTAPPRAMPGMDPGHAPPDEWRAQGPAIAHEPWFAGAADSISRTWQRLPDTFYLSRRVAGKAALAALIVSTVFFFFGRWSSVESEPQARFVLGPRLPASPPSATDVALRPCLMLRAPSSWADSASRDVPFELAATSDQRLAIGYAASAYEARGLIVDPANGAVEVAFSPEEGETRLSRVTPKATAQGVVFATTVAEMEGVNRGVAVGVEDPFAVGFSEGAVVVQHHESEPIAVWALEEGERKPESLRVVVLPGQAVGVTYRHGLTIWVGWLQPDGTVLRAAEAVSGSGRRVGKPMLAFHGKQAVVVFSNEPDEEDAVKEVRWARGEVGGAMGASEPVAIPAGGPGGDAIAPAIASVADGRWILMWTEGSRGRRVLRAQTFDAAFHVLGDALRVSPATGNFGQGTVGVSATRAAIAFLLATGRGRYELWGTVLQCD